MKHTLRALEHGGEIGREGADEETDRAERRRSAAQSAGAQRQAARRRTAVGHVRRAGLTVSMADGAVRIRHQEGRPQQPDRPRGRRRAAARAVEVGRRRRRSRARAAVLGVAAVRAAASTATRSRRCSGSARPRKKPPAICGSRSKRCGRRSASKRWRPSSCTWSRRRATSDRHRTRRAGRAAGQVRGGTPVIDRLRRVVDAPRRNDGTARAVVPTGAPR